MTKEDKELVLKDLCARLPYGIIISVHDTFPCTVLPYFNMRLNSFVSILSSTEQIIKTEDKLIKRILKEHAEYLEFRPYLRPMSSMTEEERIEFTNLYYKWYDDELFDYIEEGAEFSIWKHKGLSPVIFDWLKSHHFDYRGLIEKGLALEAPEGMYK